MSGEDRQRSTAGRISIAAALAIAAALSLFAALSCGLAAALLDTAIAAGRLAAGHFAGLIALLRWTATALLLASLPCGLASFTLALRQGRRAVGRTLSGRQELR